MNKQIFLVLTVFFTSIYYLGAQTIREFSIERLPDEVAVYNVSCASPSQGVLVFRSTIPNLRITMWPPSALFNINHNAQRNEYVLCVQPTDRRYRVSINHPEFGGIDYMVDSIGANQAKIFRLNATQQSELNATVRELIILGNYSFGNGQFSEAENQFRRAYAEEPTNTTVLRRLAETCLKLNKIDEAANFLQHIIRLSPQDDEAHNMLGEIYFSQGRYSNAASSFISAASLSYDNMLYRSNLQKAMNSHPQASIGHTEAGNRFLEHNNYTEALHHLMEASRLDPQNTTLQNSIQVVEMRIRQSEHMAAASNAFMFAVAEAQKAKVIGLLTPEWHESAEYYEFEYQYQFLDDDEWLKNYLLRNPDTPFRGAIENREHERLAVIHRRQEEHMTAAAEAFGYTRSLIGIKYIPSDPHSRVQMENNERPYRQTMEETRKAQALGPLVPELQERADFYALEYEYQLLGGKVSNARLRDFLTKYPESPSKSLIEGRLEGRLNKNKSFGFWGYTGENRAMAGMTFGKLNAKKLGWYFTFRMTPTAEHFSYRFQGDPYKVDEKGQILDKNDNILNNYQLSENLHDVNINFALGFTKRLFYPVWMYIGGGMSFSETINSFDLGNEKTYARYLEHKNNVFMLDGGLSLKLGPFVFSGGMNTDFKNHNGTFGLQFAF